MVTVNELAKIVGGTVVGDGQVRVRGMSAAAQAEEGDITFAFNAEELEKGIKSHASCILTTVKAKECNKPVLCVDDMKLAATVLYNSMESMKPRLKGFIHPGAVIDKTAEIGKDVIVGPNVVIGEGTVIGDNTEIRANCVLGRKVRIGSNVSLYPNVTLYDHVELRDRVILHSGIVVGADGFGYISKDGMICKVPQVGGVIIEEDVEIGANSCVDRGTFGNTVVGMFSKLDNHVQVAHNVHLGKGVLIAGGSAIGGSTTIGDATILGGKVGLSDHLKIGRNARIGAGSALFTDVGDGQMFFGFPAREASEAKKLHLIKALLIRHLDKFKRFLRSLPDK